VRSDPPPARAPVIAVSSIDASPAPDAAPPAPDAPPPAPPPEVTFATATMSDGVALYRTGARGVELVSHGARAPGSPDVLQLVWTGPHDLYARLEDGGVAVLRGDTLAPIKLPPERTWRVPHTRDEIKTPGGPVDSLATSGAELWRGVCAWGSSDGELFTCDEWAWARIAPAPVIVRREAPASDPEPAPPESEAARDVTMEVVNGVLRCTIAGRTIEYPPADQRDASYEGMGDVRWLWPDPPLASVEQIEPTYDSNVRVPVVFEGCTPRARGTIHVGPGDVLAVLDGGAVSLWWHGRAIGSVPAETFAFAPAR
jgi:hypothetical protein